MKTSGADAPDAASMRLGFDLQRLDRLHRAMNAAVDDGLAAGIVTLLCRHGEVVDLRAHGRARLTQAAPLSPAALFRIYSMTKPVTAVAMMMLFEEGLWRLDDPIAAYVPEFADLQVFAGLDASGRCATGPVSRPPTLRELMSHTAGFGYGIGLDDPVDRILSEAAVLQSNGLHEMIQKVARAPLASDPGQKWRYSVSVDIQGYIVERLSGMSFGAFLKTRLFDPLGMTDTGFQVPADQADRLVAVYANGPDGRGLIEAADLPGPGLQDYLAVPSMESGGGGLVSTASDYGRFAQMLLNGGELEGVRILAPATVALMGANMVTEDMLDLTAPTAGFGAFNYGVGFGLGVQVSVDPHRAGSLEGAGTLYWGGAAGTWFWVDPANDLFFVGMTQKFMAGPSDDFYPLSKTLVYQALVEPGA